MKMLKHHNRDKYSTFQAVIRYGW